MTSANAQRGSSVAAIGAWFESVAAAFEAMKPKPVRLPVIFLGCGERECSEALIEDGIPIPPPASNSYGRWEGPLKIAMRQMQVGQSTVTSLKNKGPWRLALEFGIKIATRQVVIDGVKRLRVWRIQ